MAERVDQGLGVVNGRIEGVGGRLDGLDGRLEGLSGVLGGLRPRLDMVDDKLAGRFGSLEGRLADIDGQLAGTEARLDERLTELSRRPVIDPTDRFDALEKRLVDAVEPLFVELRTRPDRGEVEET